MCVPTTVKKKKRKDETQAGITDPYPASDAITINYKRKRTNTFKQGLILEDGVDFNSNSCYLRGVFISFASNNGITQK